MWSTCLWVSDMHKVSEALLVHACARKIKKSLKTASHLSQRSLVRSRRIARETRARFTSIDSRIFAWLSISGIPKFHMPD